MSGSNTLLVDMAIPTRPKMILRKEGCATADDVRRITWVGAKRIPGFGVTAVYQTQKALEACGCPWEDAPPPPLMPRPAPRTVRVRILVAVDDVDYWSATGSSHIDEEDARRHLNCSRSARYSWVEADVPLPEPEGTILGEVTADKGEG